MSTMVYSFINDTLSFEEEVENHHQNPGIVLYSFDSQLSDDRILELFCLNHAEIESYVAYPFIKKRVSRKPKYFIYYISENN